MQRPYLKALIAVMGFLREGLGFGGEGLGFHYGGP